MAACPPFVEVLNEPGRSHASECERCKSLLADLGGEVSVDGHMDCSDAQFAIDSDSSWLEVTAETAPLYCHLESCEICRAKGIRAIEKTVPASSKRVSGTLLERGEAVGRYILVDKLGEGGMGVVLSAYDPELDRKVAIKLLRVGVLATNPEEAKERLLREAQAMAKVRHPNVVAVYEVGRIRDQVFVAMEFVEGQSLRDWLVPERSVSDVISVFAEAGRGLAAAHAAGLVHRDFKPENVLIGEGGRAQVADFGLVGSERAWEQAPSTDSNLTQPGKVMGTPAYMSPEQHDGATLDARSDQFSFCVSLHEALTGRRARAPGDVESKGLPSWLTRLLKRGLQENPADRFESMTPLLGELGRRRSKRGLALAAAAGLGLSAVVLLSVSSDAADNPCPTFDSSIVWSSEMKDEVQTALASGDASAAQISQTVANISNYVARSAEIKARACHETRVAKRETEMLFELKRQCLAEQERAASELVSILSTQATTGARAQAASASLPPLARCANSEWLLARVKPPKDPETAITVARLQATFARGRVLFHLAKYEQAARELAVSYDDAMSLDYLPVKAEAASRLGHIVAWTGKTDESVRLLRESARFALAARDYELAAVAWGYLAFVVGLQQLDQEAAVQIADDAVALLDGLPGMDEERSRVLARRGIIRAHWGDESGGVADLKTALALAAKVFGPDDPETAYTNNSLAEALFDQEAYQASLEQARKAASIFETSFSNSHPQSVISRQLVARCLQRLGQPEPALEMLLELEPRLEEAFTFDPFEQKSFFRYVVAETLQALGRSTKAREAYEAAREGFRRVYKEDNWRIVNVEKGLEQLDRK